MTNTVEEASATLTYERQGVFNRILSWPASRAFLAVILIFAVSPMISTASVGSLAIKAMLPFASLIAVVAMGQTLVIQQGGLDLSIPGSVALGTIIVGKYGSDPHVGLTGSIVLAIVLTSLFGLLSGVIVVQFGLPPLVVTLASNALMVGAVQAITGGFSVQSPVSLSTFAISRWAGLPVIFVIVSAVAVVIQVILKLTRVGRCFELVGENPRSAKIIGFKTKSYVISAYCISAAMGAGCGVLLIGLLNSPSINPGDTYLLPSIAAVVLGGTALTGGRGSLIGTAMGALFLGQLSQLVQTFTQTTAVQNIIQASIIGIGIVAQIQLGGSTLRLRKMASRSKVEKT